MNIDPCWAGWRALRHDRKIDITARAVSVGDCFGIVMKSFWRVDRVLFHLEDGADLFLRRDLVARDRNLADVILRPLSYHDRNDHGAILATFFADIFHFHVDVAVVLVEFFNAIEVLL